MKNNIVHHYHKVYFIRSAECVNGEWEAGTRFESPAVIFSAGFDAKTLDEAISYATAFRGNLDARYTEYRIMRGSTIIEAGTIGRRAA